MKPDKRPGAHPARGLRAVHAMPFGPRPARAGEPAAGYEFRLWAPSEREAEVVLAGAGGPQAYPCLPAADGWHRCVVAEARPGDLYSFRLGRFTVPDPASRFNPHGVHGPSRITAPEAFAWDAGWRGRPWEEAVIYELHVGAFTPAGRYAAAEARLGELAELGVTAIELMPLAAFPGQRGWGYDGVLPYAPHAAYGTPDELKHFIQAAHRHGLMVFLDVVYNHFGPDGNYLHAYARPFFNRRRQTPWGDAINFEGADGATVREFFIHNALYWLEEFRFDGLRLDAVHAIFDAAQPPFLEELSRRARAACAGRHVHLVLENDRNQASLLAAPGRPGRYEAQWNDDFHHAAHVVLTGETDGYYADFAARPAAMLRRCLSSGFAFQGEYSLHSGTARGERCDGLPSGAFVNFLQNHDQIGNRARGERLTVLVPPRRLRALVALQLLSPATPLIFMGEEAGARTPFHYFCDFQGELAEAVREGRRRELAGLDAFADGEDGPDPCAEAAFLASKLDWAARETPEAREWRDFYRELLLARRRQVAPLLDRLRGGEATALGGDGAFEVLWAAGDGEALLLLANLDDAASPPVALPPGRPFAAVGAADGAGPDRLAPWSVLAYRLSAGEARA